MSAEEEERIREDNTAARGKARSSVSAEEEERIREEDTAARKLARGVLVAARDKLRQTQPPDSAYRLAQLMPSHFDNFERFPHVAQSLYNNNNDQVGPFGKLIDISLENAVLPGVLTPEYIAQAREETSNIIKARAQAIIDARPGILLEAQENAPIYPDGKLRPFIQCA